MLNTIILLLYVRIFIPVTKAIVFVRNTKTTTSTTTTTIRVTQLPLLFSLFSRNITKRNFTKHSSNFKSSLREERKHAACYLYDRQRQYELPSKARDWEWQRGEEWKTKKLFSYFNISCGKREFVRGDGRSCHDHSSFEKLLIESQRLESPEEGKLSSLFLLPKGINMRAISAKNPTRILRCCLRCHIQLNFSAFHLFKSLEKLFSLTLLQKCRSREGKHVISDPLNDQRRMSMIRSVFELWVRETAKRSGKWIVAFHSNHKEKLLRDADELKANTAWSKSHNKIIKLILEYDFVFLFSLSLWCF